MITVTYVTASHPNHADFERFGMSDARAPIFVAEMAKLQDGSVNCHIVNENVLTAFRTAVAREEIDHEKILLVYSSAKGEEWCRFSRYGVVLKRDSNEPVYPQAHGVVDMTSDLIIASMARKKRDKENCKSEETPQGDLNGRSRQD